ncbi:MAG: 3-dehydroquinate synthase [Kiritimatiellae bacterium]|nr:3-dehydroquinate synthase [Kiritimatiellia bacterium]
MSRTVRVGLGDRAYEIRIAARWPGCGSRPGGQGRRALIVSDSNVAPLYGRRVQESFEELGFLVNRVVVPAGEESKSLSVLPRLYTAALESGLDRSSVIVALGGGMVGDLAGFLAGTFMRGIPLIQVPTSLVAMVDSAVGGKTAVNLPEGKNLVGVFHQPIEVVIDLSMLDSLPEREYRSGLAEVVKYGVIRDEALFRALENQADKLLARDLGLLETVVARCCEIKAEVVALDEKESGPRAILNFGHTLGHALEKLTDYRLLLHGEAVAIGMSFAAALSVRSKGLAEEHYTRVVALLDRLGLPRTVAALGEKGGDWHAVREAMAMDKKSQAGTPRFVLIERLGSAVFGCEIPERVLEETYLAMLGS